MKKSIENTISNAVGVSKELYYRLVLLTGESGSGKTAVLRNLADKLGMSIINVNLELSRMLMELTAKQRSLRLPKLLESVVNHSQTTVIFDNLEILFDKDLKQDPLRLLQDVSRNRSVIASWNGTWANGKLTYAEADHPEYRRYDSVDAIVVNMDGTSSIDLTLNNKTAELA